MINANLITTTSEFPYAAYNVNEFTFACHRLFTEALTLNEEVQALVIESLLDEQGHIDQSIEYARKRQEYFAAPVDLNDITRLSDLHDLFVEALEEQANQQYAKRIAERIQVLAGAGAAKVYFSAL